MHPIEPKKVATRRQRMWTLRGNWVSQRWRGSDGNVRL